MYFRIILCIFSILIFMKRSVHASTCGYASCPQTKKDMLNVHLVPHTHDDVGWLKTVEQYYYGSKTYIQNAGVQYIIDSVVRELLKDPKKKFIYVESAFFFKWWNEQNADLQEKVYKLVQEGRLEFIGGAWSMNDEATTHYQSIIDQFSWGLRKLNDTFGNCGRPKIGWQIDPFGHSREMASLFAQMGYDGLFFGRLDHKDKENRLYRKTAEMIWNASPNLGATSDLFTGALYNQYQAPSGFCFDILCADEPIIDDTKSPNYNVDRRIKEFLNYVEVMSHGYRTNNVLITMGEDFHYQIANMWYKNLDKLIKYGNNEIINGTKVNLFYSTPSCYLKALHDSNIKWPTKQDDFFPYGSDINSYWTGYFTSRPTLKRFERVGNHFLQICKQITALSARNNEREFKSHLSFMREAMGVMQHHDAVTGTEKQHVANDYAKHLEIAFNACSQNIKAILNKMVTGEDATEKVKVTKNPDFDYENMIHTRNNRIDMYYFILNRNLTFEFEHCLLLNISECKISETRENFIVTTYNALSRSRYDYIRLPVGGKNYIVRDYRDIEVPSQVVEIPSTIYNIRYRNSSSKYDLIFFAGELPPMGYKSYYVSRLETGTSNVLGPEKAVNETVPKTIKIGNNNMQLTFVDGQLSNIEHFKNSVNMKITQEFAYYSAMAGSNEHAGSRASGAYIFRPNGNETTILSTNPRIEVIKGDFVEEVRQTFNEWISQVIRVYKDDNHAEFEWLVGPIPISDGIGKEIITRFKTEIKSNGTFYTDSNGREMIKRIRNYRETWNHTTNEPISSNYYPLTTKIALEDNATRMAILVDRAQGGSSIINGSLEIMIHRRLLYDDAFGVNEPLNETAYGAGLVARGQHYLVVGAKNTTNPTLEAQERFLQIEKLLPTWAFVSDAKNFSFETWRTKFTHIASGITLSLPKQVNLMTFEPWHENEVLIRFEHLLEKHEGGDLSRPVVFNLKDVFHNMQIESMTETTLDGNQWLDDMERLTFKAETTNTDNIASDELHRKQILYDMLRKMQLRKEYDQFQIIIQPMQIRTFIIKLSVDQRRYRIPYGMHFKS